MAASYGAYLTAALVFLTCCLPQLQAVDFPTCSGGAASIEEYVEYITEVLTESSLPYWNGLVDEVNGGYIVERGSKFVVEQARLVYVFSIMEITGIKVPEIDNYDAARTGVDFLLEHFKDPVYGGYYWGTDEAGNVIDDRKYLYGEAFGVISMATFYRAFGETWAKEEALALVNTIYEHMSDRESSFGGWFEHCERDWTVITEGEGELGPNGVKTSNALLHWMESMTDLAETVDDHPEVDAILTQLLDKDILEFYPENPEDAISERDLEGNVLVTGEEDYGHLIEFDWVMLRAQRALGREEDWDKFDRYFQYVVEALDPASGGIIDDIPELVWWRQCELVTAFSAEKCFKGTVAEAVLTKVLDLIICHFIDRQDGALYYALDGDTMYVKDPSRSNKWKAGYHETRALAGFVTFFATPSPDMCVWF